MGTVKALLDPLTTDNIEPSSKLLIFVYWSTPREHAVIFGGREVVDVRMSYGVTKLCRGFLNIEDKKEVFNCDVFSLYFIQNERGYKEFEGVWDKLHGMETQSRQKLKD